MALHFVTTTVLSSDDGINFDNEEKIESDETRQAKLLAEQASNKPLFEQLEDLKAKKQAEYDQNTKKLFAPPKALDEEDVAFFEQLDETKAKAMKARSQREETALASFRSAQKEQTSTPSINDHIMAIPQKKVVDNSIACPVVFKRKKIKDETKTKDKDNQEDTTEESSNSKRIKSIAGGVETNIDKKEANASSSIKLSSLCDYGSDDED